MKKFTTLLSVVLAIAILFSSCATILNGSNQPVAINTNSSDTRVYVDSRNIGKGRHLETRVDRDLKAKQLKASREGYKDEYMALYQSKKSPLYILSWVPFGIVWAFLFDNGARSFDYDKEARINVDTKINVREDDQKFLYLKNTAFNVAKNDLTVLVYSDKRYKKNKGVTHVETSDEDLEFDNSVFTETLNETLKKYGYIDTLNQILKDQTNTLKISGSVETLTFSSVYVIGSSSFYPHYIIAETKVEWELFDVYDQSKLKITNRSKSGEFALSDNFGETTKDAVEDALMISFFDLLNDRKVKRLLQLSEKKSVTYESLAISNPTSIIQNLNDATQSTVTITTEKGHGSGCVISNDGYIVTNFHVVANEEKPQVVLNNGQKIDATLVRKNEYADLALLKINKNFDYSFFVSDSIVYNIGNDVFAIGTPTSVELGQTLSKGIISGLRKKNEDDLIQTDVSISPGNSGGALVSEDGQLIGIVNSKVIGFGVEGLNFCIPAKDVKRLLGFSYQ